MDEEDEAFVLAEKQSLWRKRQIEEHLGQPVYFKPSTRTWVGLTDEDIDQGLLRSDYVFKTAAAWRAGVVFAMTKLKEKNT